MARKENQEKAAGKNNINSMRVKGVEIFLQERERNQTRRKFIFLDSCVSTQG